MEIFVPSSLPETDSGPELMQPLSEGPSRNALPIVDCDGYLTVLYTTYHSSLLTFASRLLHHDGEEAEQVVQDVWEKLIAWLPELLGKGDFRPRGWLYQATQNCCFDLLRHRQAISMVSAEPLLSAHQRDWGHSGVQGGYSGRDLASFRASAIEPRTGEHAALQAEEAQAVRATLALLPARWALAVALRSYGQYSYDEIAAAMGSTRPGVKALIFRARRLFAELWPWHEAAQAAGGYRGLLVRLCREKRLGQDTMARLSGLHPSTVQRTMDGRGPRAALLSCLRIALAYGPPCCTRCGVPVKALPAVSAPRYCRDPECVREGQRVSALASYWRRRGDSERAAAAVRTVANPLSHRSRPHG